MQNELSQQVISEVGNINVLDVEVDNLLNQLRVVDVLEEDVNLVLCRLGNSVEQVVDTLVARNSLVVQVLVRSEVERIDSRGCQVVLRVNRVCFAVLCVSALQAALVELQALHNLIDIGCYALNTCVETVLGNLIKGILDGSLVDRQALYLLHVNGSNDSISLVEAVVGTCVAELQHLGALLGTFELDGRLFVLSIDNVQFKARKVGGVGVDGHVDLTCIVLLVHERNVCHVLEDLNAVDHLHILLGESLLGAYIITCARCGELNVLHRLAEVGNKDVGLNVEGQIQCAEGRVVCALDDDAGYLLCKEFLNSRHSRLETLNVIESLLDVCLGNIHPGLQSVYSAFQLGELPADGFHSIVQITYCRFVSADSAKNLCLVCLVSVLLDGSGIKCGNHSLGGDDVRECRLDRVADDVHALLELFVCQGRSERVGLHLVNEERCQVVQFAVHFLGSDVVEVVKGQLQGVNLVICSTDLVIHSANLILQVFLQLCNLLVDKVSQLLLHRVDKLLVGGNSLCILSDSCGIVPDVCLSSGETLQDAVDGCVDCSDLAGVASALLDGSDSSVDGLDSRCVLPDSSGEAVHDTLQCAKIRCELLDGCCMAADGFNESLVPIKLCFKGSDSLAMIVDSALEVDHLAVKECYIAFEDLNPCCVIINRDVQVILELFEQVVNFFFGVDLILGVVICQLGDEIVNLGHKCCPDCFGLFFGIRLCRHEVGSTLCLHVGEFGFQIGNLCCLLRESRLHLVDRAFDCADLSRQVSNGSSQVGDGRGVGGHLSAEFADSRLERCNRCLELLRLCVQIGDSS